jgi:uncharacterized protein YacL
MNCYVSGMLGLAFLGGSIATLTVSKEEHNLLRSTLSEELDKKYQKISNQRRNHYIVGLIIGLLISFIVIKNTNIKNHFTRVTLFFTITLATAIIFYMIMPKSDYMLNHLKTPEQNKRWLDIYKTMKNKYILGFILGILAAIPLANTFCK